MKGKLTDQVEYVLQKSRGSRDSDKKLIMNVLWLNGLRLTEEQVDVLMSVNLGTVTRIRRKFQEEGKYRGTMWAERQARAEGITPVMPGTHADGVEELIDGN